MIQYNKGAFGLNLLWRLQGSAVYRAMFPGWISVVVYLLIRLQWKDQDVAENDDLGHPYAVGVLVGSVSFLIIFRANHGYNRYWEACGAVHHCLSKWMDATTHTAVYHMQCSHYDSIKPPSYFDFPQLNDGFYTRARERSYQGGEDERKRTISRSVAKSINFVEDSKKRENVNVLLFEDEEEEIDPTEPRPLLGRGRLDGGWGELFPGNGLQPSATYYNPRKEWNHDGKGFASTAGGRTPALFLQELAHLSSLLSAVALATLRNDIDGAESPLDVYEAGAPWPEADPTHVDSVKWGWSDKLKFLTGADRTPEARTKHNASRPLPVIGGVSDNEIRFLQMARGPYAKTQLCWQWLSEFIVREHLSGSTGKVGPPIISRIIQFLSDGMISYNHARKIMWIPFPFPHAQLSVFYVISMVFAVPFLMDQYANETWLGGTLTLLTVTCLAGLHEVARELENPFRNVPNELPLCTIQAFYNEALITMYSGFHPDSYWDPEQVKHHRPRSRPESPDKKPQTTIPAPSSDVGSDHTTETDLSHLQALIEEQGREIERLKSRIKEEGKSSE